MSSSQSRKRTSSSSRHSETGLSRETRDLISLITTILIGIILLTGPLILGAARLWIQLPLLGGVAFLLLIQGLRLSRPASSDQPRRIDAIDISVILFTVYTIVLWFFSPSEYYSRIEAMDVLAYAVIFFTSRYGIANRSYGMALLYGLVALGIFETGFGYYLGHHYDYFPFGETERLHIHYAPRWVGTYGSPNHYGGFLVMAIGIALALGCFSRLSWPVRIVFFYIAGAMVAGVAFSLSRGSYLALAVSILALSAFGLRHGAVRRWVPIAATILVLVGGVIVFSMSLDIQERYRDAADYTSTTNTQLTTYVRFVLDRDALYIAKDHPVFGTGPATFGYIHPRYQDQYFNRRAVLTSNDYLNCLDDYGLVGLSIAMFFVFAVTYSFFQPLRSDYRWQDRVIIAAAFAAWGALLMHSILDFNLHIPANALVFFALIGLGLGRMRPAEDAAPHWSTVSLVPLRGWLGWALVLLSLVFLGEAGRSAASDIIYEQAYNQEFDVPSSESIQDAEGALTYDPGNVQDLIFLGDLYRFEAAHQTAIEDRIREGQKAMDYYQRALQANTLDDGIRARMGLTFDIMRRYSEAYFCYKAAVAEQPYNGDYWYWMGNHFWQRGMLAKAEEAYVRSQQCPYGNDGSDEAIHELRSLPDMQDVPKPSPDVNPIASPEEVNEQHPATEP